MKHSQPVDGGTALVRAILFLVGIAVALWVYYVPVLSAVNAACTTCSGEDVLWIMFGWIPAGMALTGVAVGAVCYLAFGRRSQHRA